jgi:hypothetical protein
MDASILCPGGRKNDTVATQRRSAKTMRRAGALTRRARSLAQAYEVSPAGCRWTGATATGAAQARGFLSYLNRLTGVAQRDEELAALRQESAAMREELDRVAQQLQVRLGCLTTKLGPPSAATSPVAPPHCSTRGRGSHTLAGLSLRLSRRR